MRLTASLFDKIMPYRFRGKYRKVKKPTLEELFKLRHDFEREERNMLILRHPYLTPEQSYGHMLSVNLQKPPIGVTFGNQKNENFAKIVTIQERLEVLRVSEGWD